MSPLAVRVAAGVLALLALIALRGKRWAYPAFIVLGLLSLAARASFRVHVPACEQLVPTMPMVMRALQNYAHIALFAGFYWMSWVQFRRTNPRILWALLATLLAGALVEIAEGMTGQGSCRVRDLVPDTAGALGAALLLAVWSRLRRKPGYVRLVRPRPTVAAPAREIAPTEEQPLQAMRQRVWAIIHGRRRTIVLGAVLIALVGAAAFVVLRLQAPAPVVTEQPNAAPPPPPRPLQSDAEGYYEPGYQFTVSDRRFTRLTLRPEPFVTFSRVGTRQEAGCQDARIGPDAVHLRCELDRVGMVTIDGRFTSRFVTSRLDTPVLNALITVTSTRGETLYRARDAFVWHPPN